MDSAKLNDWLQVIGLFGVIASLIFVGLQMKQDREIAMSAAYQARSSQISEIQTAMAGDPAMRGFFHKVDTGKLDEITPDEANATVLYLGAVFNFYENVHYQYMNGFIDDEHWEKSRGGLKNMLYSDFARSIFLESIIPWRTSYQALAEEIIAEIDAEEANK